MSTPRRRGSPARRNQRRRSAPARDFWGTEHANEPEKVVIEPSEHPAALIESLGPPPFPGAGLAQHYFDAIYGRAAALAFALGVCGGRRGDERAGRLGVGTRDLTRGARSKPQALADPLRASASMLTATNSTIAVTMYFDAALKP